MSSMKKARFLRLVGAVCLALTAIGGSGMASAAERVGVAAAIQKDVSGSLGGSQRALSSGDSVFRDERVSTSAASSAQLMFLDETNLAIGPSSEVVLDRFVYNPDKTASDLSLSATKGVLRFISGSSQSRNYSIETPVATIGVRGTILDLIVEASRSTIILVEGASDVCIKGGRCLGLVKPGTYITVHAGGRMEGPRTWDGTLRRIKGRASFPLFGQRVAGDLSEPRPQIDRRAAVDELESREMVDYYHRLYRRFEFEPVLGARRR